MLRLVVLGGASLVLAATAHTLGGGSLPGGGVLLVAFGLLGLVALVVTQRRCRFPVLLAVLGLEQAALHLVFSAAADIPADCLTEAVGSSHHVGRVTPLGCEPLIEVPSVAPMMVPATGMWIAHLVAIAATAWLLSRGEAWLWRTADRIVRAATAAPTPSPRGWAVARATGASAPAHACSAAAPAAPRGPPSGRPTSLGEP